MADYDILDMAVMLLDEEHAVSVADKIKELLK